MSDELHEIGLDDQLRPLLTHVLVDAQAPLGLQMTICGLLVPPRAQEARAGTSKCVVCAELTAKRRVR